MNRINIHKSQVIQKKGGELSFGEFEIQFVLTLNNLDFIPVEKVPYFTEIIYL